MRLFYTFLPITGVVLAILIMKDYDISEEKANEIKKQLELKNKK
jgi:GPH family glycoside/pentoside/hexuronide:cation symporter